MAATNNGWAKRVPSVTEGQVPAIHEVNVYTPRAHCGSGGAANALCVRLTFRRESSALNVWLHLWMRRGARFTLWCGALGSTRGPLQLNMVQGPGRQRRRASHSTGATQRRQSTRRYVLIYATERAERRASERS